jgi:hypothetical protein
MGNIFFFLPKDEGVGWKLNGLCKLFCFFPIPTKVAIKICFSADLSGFYLYAILNVDENNDLIICRNKE